MDEEAAKASPLFTGCVAYGYFVIAAAGLFIDPDSGPVLANFGLQHLRCAAGLPGDSIKLRLKHPQR